MDRGLTITCGTLAGVALAALAALAWILHTAHAQGVTHG